MSLPLSLILSVRAFNVLFHISCLSSDKMELEPSRLECLCLDSPQQGTIQNLMYEIRDRVRWARAQRKGGRNSRRTPSHSHLIKFTITVDIMRKFTPYCHHIVKNATIWCVIYWWWSTTDVMYVRPTTREVLLDSCPDSYYNININLGEKADEQKKIGKFVLRHFKSVTVHLVGRLHQVEEVLLGSL